MLNILSLSFWKNSIIVFIFILFVVIVLPEIKEWIINTPWENKGGHSHKNSIPAENLNRPKVSFKDYCRNVLRLTLLGFIITIGCGCLLFIFQNFSSDLKTIVKNGAFRIPNTDYIVNLKFLNYYLKFSSTWILIIAIASTCYLLFITLFRFKKNSTLKVPSSHMEVTVKNQPNYSGTMNKDCPPLSLLHQYEIQNSQQDETLKMRLQQCFDEYDLVFLSILKVEVGPTITRFTIKMDTSGRLNQLFKLEKEISMYLGVENISMSSSANGIIIDVPNKKKISVNFREVLGAFIKNKTGNPLNIPLGKTAIGNLQTMILNDAPHLLISGSTGSGKSVCINEIIISILYNATPNDVKFIFVDPKVVEMSCYNGIPHLLAPVITDPNKAAAMLEWAVQEMEERYKKLAAEGVRNIQSYNEKLRNKDKMPSIVIVIDELADLMLVAKKNKNKNENSVEESIQRLGQKARAAGIHLVVGTQRPSADVITGTIKTNIPARIAFQVADGLNSRIIIDSNGAEKLLGKGDGLLLTPGAITRFQSAFISDEEIERVVAWWKNQSNNYSKDKLNLNEVINCSLFDQENLEISINSNPEPNTTELNLKKDQTSSHDDCYNQLRLYIAKMALSEDEEVFLPSTRNIEEELKINHRYAIENLKRLSDEGWIIKIGDSPRTMKYQVLLSQDDALLELENNK
ncbi:DNA translocase FtsK [Ruminiclostridium cellobioparum]|uniref:DNA translocase FtsK n=1 Tax=Ruminiclostridium cellobioparum TaxID=29355 RepID=UPI0028B25636|nr:DNA translocase FtsK [Ruminiclostridium cellobioparum]